MKDNVNHPGHYTQGGVECIDAIAAATTGKTGIEAVCVANVIKYLWRYELKNGIEDVKKARWYLDRLITELEGKAAVKECPHEFVMSPSKLAQGFCRLCGEAEEVELKCSHEWVAYGMSKDKTSGCLATLRRCRLCGRRERSGVGI